MPGFGLNTSAITGCIHLVETGLLEGFLPLFSSVCTSSSLDLQLSPDPVQLTFVPCAIFLLGLGELLFILQNPAVILLQETSLQK